VVSVTWQDAVDYCEWLSGKIGAEVRLPNEKEWRLAAAGESSLKYPWGNEWKPRAANYKDTKLGVRPVKSFPEGRSPCGAYDMAGNVWEWTSDDALDHEGKPKEENGVKRKIIKGGSAAAKQDYLNTSARFDLPANAADPVVGFRYVVIRKGDGAQSSKP
jgi:formylglycine-generating enzyme required for sulfatase activity